MRGSTLWLLAVAFTLALPLSGAQAAGGVEEGKAGIAQSNAKWEAGVKAGDAAAIAALYMTDALILPPGEATVQGRAGAEKFFGGMLKAGVKSVTLNTENVERAGDYAIETGTVTLTVQPEGKEAQKSTAKYVVVWKHQKDGSWQLHRDIWNENPHSKS
jgi:uncharacterized protein (TIGR02246 family)